MVDILVVEDNREIASMVCDFLRAEGFTVTHADNGDTALELYADVGARLVLLDVMLHGADGFAICRQIRRTDSTPIFMISARVSKDDKLSGLLMGADDYIEKPFDIDILIAKINGVFSRRYDSGVLSCADIELDRQRRTVSKAGVPLKMTPKEFDLLELLMEKQGTALSKEMLFSRIWGPYSDSEQQTLTVHIKWLREKIEDDPKNPAHIITVRGVGYRFEV